MLTVLVRSKREIKILQSNTPGKVGRDGKLSVTKRQ